MNSDYRRGVMVGALASTLGVGVPTALYRYYLYHRNIFKDENDKASYKFESNGEIVLHDVCLFTGLSTILTGVYGVGLFLLNSTNPYLKI